jgi:hypothetical protein
MNEYHRWVAQHGEKVGLSTSEQTTDFIHSLGFYARWFKDLDPKSSSLIPELPDLGYIPFYSLQDVRVSILTVLNPDLPREKNLLIARLMLTYRQVKGFYSLWNGLRSSPGAMVRNLIPLLIELRKVQSSEEPQVEIAAILIRDILKTGEPLASQSSVVYKRVSDQALRYILGSLTAYVEHLIVPEDAIHWSRFLQAKYEVEHIIPQKKFGDNETGHRLGNLLLMPKSMNASMRDSDYSKKASFYAKNNKLAALMSPESGIVTLEGEISPSSGPNLRRFVQKNPQIKFKAYQDFTLDDIDEREHFLASLALEIWNIERLLSILDEDDAELTEILLAEDLSDSSAR